LNNGQVVVNLQRSSTFRSLSPSKCQKNIHVWYGRGSRDSAVGIATGYGLDDRGVGIRVPVGSRIFSSPRCPDRLWGPPSLLSPGVKRLGREADHSPPITAEVKKTWIYRSTSPYVFIAYCLIIQARGHVYFYMARQTDAFQDFPFPEFLNLVHRQLVGLL
jgi:hypothetical protein